MSSTPLPQSTESRAVNVAGGNSRCYATDQDWTRQKDLIRDLYEKQPLAKVMCTMESQHDFRATEKMYKTRIQRWGLDKKKKEPEMRAIAQIIKHRSRQGKRSSIFVRERPVDLREVLRYWERKGVSFDEVAAQRRQSVTPDAIVCLTPLRSPIETPDSLATPERTLMYVRDYFKGSFESGISITKDPQRGCETTKDRGDTSAHLDALNQEWTTSIALFSKGRYEEAGQMLNSASSKVKCLLLAEHPATFTHIFHLLIYTIRAKKSEIAFAMLRQFSALGKIFVGAEHPLSRVCGWLASMDPLQLEDVAIRCSRSTTDHLESLAGFMDRSTVVCRVNFIQSLVYEQHNGHRQGMLQDLLEQCEGLLGRLDARTLSVRAFLAFQYGNQRNHAETMKLGWSIIIDAQELPLLTDRVWFHTQGLLIIAKSRYDLGDTISAGMYLWEAIQQRVWVLGLQDGRARGWLVLLEHWFLEQGRLIDATQVEKRRKEIQVKSSEDLSLGLVYSLLGWSIHFCGLSP